MPVAIRPNNAPSKPAFARTASRASSALHLLCLHSPFRGLLNKAPHVRWGDLRLVERSRNCRERIDFTFSERENLPTASRHLGCGAFNILGGFSSFVVLDLRGRLPFAARLPRRACLRTGI